MGWVIGDRGVIGIGRVRGLRLSRMRGRGSYGCPWGWGCIVDPGKGIADLEYERIVSWVTGQRGYDGLEGLLEGEAASRKVRERCALWSCALAFLGECGLRVGELIGLKGDDVWETEKPKSALVVRAAVAKYGKARLIPLLGPAWKAANVYGGLRSACVDRPAEDPWFGCGPPWRAITARTVQRWTEAWGRQALARAVHPHAFRHFCLNRLRRVSDIVTVAEIAGHRSIRTTQGYTAVGAQDMRAAMEKASEFGGGA